MLQATHSRPHSHLCQQQQQHNREAVFNRIGFAGSLRLLVLLAALGSAVGGAHPLNRQQHLSRIVGSQRHSCFLGPGSEKEKPPAVLAPSSPGDPVRVIGERVRGGGLLGWLSRKGGDSAREKDEEEAKAMAAAQQTPKDKSNGRNSFIAGGLAGSVSTTITCPIEVRARLPCRGNL